LLYYGVKCYHRIKYAVKTWLKREDDIVEYQERDEVWQAAQAGNRHCVVKGGQEEKGKALMGIIDDLAMGLGMKSRNPENFAFVMRNYGVEGY